MYQVLQCASAHWSPAIGDPTPLGWLTTIAYFGAALLAAFALRVAPAGPLPKRRAYLHFWWLMIVAFTALGINKELDLQSLFTVAAKCLASRDGWYNDRRHVQVIFILSAVGLGVLLLLAALVHFRKVIGLVGIAIVGVVFVSTFVVVRAASFHQVDHLIGTYVLGVRVNGFLELPGIMLVAANALWLTIVRRRTSRSAGSRS